MKWTKFWALLLAALVLPSAAAAQIPSSSGITTKNLGGGLRTRTLQFYFVPDYSATNSSSGCYAAGSAIGDAGCAAVRACGNGATTCTLTETSSSASSAPEVGAVWPPSKLWVAIDDDLNTGSAAAVSCTAVTIYGRNAAGAFISENLGSVDETGESTAYAYSRVSKMVATGCTNFSAYDELFAQQIPSVAFGGDPVRSFTEIESLCTTVSGVTKCLSGTQLDFYENASYPFIDKRAGTIDLVRVNTYTDTESQVDLVLDTNTTPVTLSWRLTPQ